MDFIFTDNVSANGNTVTGAATRSADGVTSREVALAASATPKEIDIDFDKDLVVGCIFKSTVDCTLKTNSSSAPDDTIPLLAGEPFVWKTNNFYDCPFTVDVTKIFAVNGSSPLAAGTLRMEVLLDSTP